MAELAQEIAYSEPYANIITIANTIHNKFPTLRIKNYFRLPSNKINHVSDVMIDALSSKRSQLDSGKSFEILRRVLAYIGFNSKIEVSFKLVNSTDSLKKINSLEYTRSLEIYDIMKVRSFLSRVPTIETAPGLWSSNEKNPKIQMVIDFEYPGIDLETEYLLSVLRLKYHLTKLKILSDVKISLYKHGEKINLNEASSGELTLLTSLSWISMHIDKKAYILIDEPENSLHPRWQREYFKNLNDLFYHYKPIIVCATHAPMVISGAHSSESKVSIYRTINGNIKKLADHHSKNIEEILTDVFQIITPESRYFSYLINKLINTALKNNIDEAELHEQLKKFKKITDDHKHLEIIDSIPNIIKEIKKNG
ncbi:AAA family ATPase [Lelliottia sp. SL45]|uniref:AAA family ATPase n=1 Tax=Lelliottia sp. SL45 TaxID=2994665 RepID=UPI002DD43FE6|nr:AAA family ATPase [Lelliottia sp. SL45]